MDLGAAAIIEQFPGCVGLLVRNALQRELLDAVTDLIGSDPL